MAIINFDQLFTDLKSGVETLAKNSFKEYEAQAKSDGQQAITDLKTNLIQWTKELETGSLTKEDLEYLLQEEEALDKMVALKQAGLAEVHVDKFRNDIITMIVTSVTKMI
jgi:hypothetical protein